MKKTTATSPAKQKILVIGNGMTGFRFCERFVSYRLHKKYDLTVFGEESQPAYDRVNLTRCLTQGDELTLAPLAWYHQQGIRLITGQRIVHIDRPSKSVKTAAGATERFDILILATGSRAYIPPVAGIDLPGVFPYRTMNDVAAIREYMKTSRQVTVVGGGILGLEAAKAMLDAGMETVIVERAGQLMPRQLDAAAANTLLTQVVSAGIKVMLNTQVANILMAGDALQLHCTNGEQFNTGIILFSAGIVPRDELAATAGLALGPRGGILVNNFMQTADTNIYAIGECAMVNGRLWGLTAPCYEMAEVMAARLAGIYKVFRGDLQFVQLKVLHTKVACISCEEDDQESAEAIIEENSQEGIYKRINVAADKKRLTGAILVGDIAAYTHLLQMIRTRSKIPEDPLSLINGQTDLTANMASWPEDMIICQCESIRKKSIVAAIRDQRLTRLEQVKMVTRACTGCETCKQVIEDMISFYQQPETMPIADDKNHLP